MWVGGRRASKTSIRCLLIQGEQDKELGEVQVKSQVGRGPQGQQQQLGVSGVGGPQAGEGYGGGSEAPTELWGGGECRSKDLEAIVCRACSGT